MKHAVFCRLAQLARSVGCSWWLSPEAEGATVVLLAVLRKQGAEGI